MQKILRSPASIRRKTLKGTFGVPLAELVRSQNGQLVVPPIVRKIVQHLQANGMNQEGIFRINGSTKAVDKMKAKFDKSQDAELCDAGDIMAVAGLLKLFLRELPDPLMTEALHEQFISLQKNFTHQQDATEYLPQLKNLLTQLPEENYLVLSYICRFLVQVTNHEDENKMNARSLSIVFGPNLFRCSDGVAGLQEQAYTNLIVRAMIEEYDTLFGTGREQNGQSSPLPDNSKRIVVKPAVEKKSPPVKPVSYEQYLKDRIGRAFAKREAEERDVNSNSVEKMEREAGRVAFDRQDAMSPCDMSSADERALSPFNLDSDSTVPSPIVSDSAIEVVDRAIKECVSEHLFGSPERNAPVPNPRTKRLQRKQKEAPFNIHQSSQGRSQMPEDLPSKSVTNRIRQYSLDSMDSLSPPTTPLAKSQQDSSAFKFFESRGVILQSSKGNKVLPTKPDAKKADKELNNTSSPSSRRKHDEFQDQEDEDDVFKEDGEDDAHHHTKRISPSHDKVTEGRTPPSRTHKNGKKGKRPVDLGDESVPTQLTELDLDSVQRESPVLEKLTEGRVHPPRTRARSRSRSRERSEGGGSVGSSVGSATTVLTNGSLQHSSHDSQPATGNTPSQGKHKTSPHKALAEAAMATRLKKQLAADGGTQAKHHDKRYDATNLSPVKTKNEHAKEKSQHDLAASPKRKKKTRLSSKEANDLRVRDIDSPEVGVVESKQGKKKTRLASNSSETGPEKSKLSGREEERSRSTSPKVNRQLPDEDTEDHLVPSLDLSSLHANAESDEPISAWSLHQRADWLNNMEELTIDVKAGPVEKVSRSWEEAPLSPRAKDTPPCWGSYGKDINMPPSPPSKQSVSFCSTADRTHDKPMDKSQNIKQLTRQVRNLKRRIRQYEEEYIEKHGYKPSTAEKAAEPEVKKMMRELKKAAKQLKAAKEQSEESNKPLHSTMPPSTVTGGKKKHMQDDSNSESSLVESLKDAMDLAEEWLKEKRKEAGRMDDIFEMSKSEVHDEKVSIQKVLLQLENKYGRPTTRETKEVMKPLYDRYRNLKRLIAKFEVRRTLAEEVVAASPPNLNTIDEHEETKEFTPKQLGTIHAMYTEEDLEPCVVTQEIPSGVIGQYRTLDPDESLQSPVDLSGRADSPLSPDSTANFKNLADASLSELIKTQNQALADKKRVRRILKEFEDNFFKEKGRKVQKEDRGPMEEEYNEYKRVKKQLKLLDALMEKHQSQTNTGVT